MFWKLIIKIEIFVLSLSLIACEYKMDENHQELYDAFIVKNYLKAEQLIKEKNLDVNKLKDTNNHTLLMMTSWNKKYDEAFYILIKNGADVNAAEFTYQNRIENAYAKFVSEDNRSTLQFAVNGGDEKKIRTLIEKGAEVNWMSRLGRTALSDAIYMGNRNATRTLLELGADPFQKIKKRKITAYDLIKEKGWTEILKYIDEKQKYSH